MGAKIVGNIETSKLRLGGKLTLSLPLACTGPKKNAQNNDHLGKKKDAEKGTNRGDFFHISVQNSRQRRTFSRTLFNAKQFSMLYLSHYLMGVGPNTKKNQNSGKQIRIPEGM